jgi:hypothetical protein
MTPTRDPAPPPPIDWLPIAALVAALAIAGAALVALAAAIPPPEPCRDHVTSYRCGPDHALAIVGGVPVCRCRPR